MVNQSHSLQVLAPNEQKWAQIEKELLAIVFACKKFNDYIYGKEVIIESDHKPLETIFKKQLEKAPARLQNMLLKLQKYNLKVVYKKGKEMYIADALSRAYLSDTSPEEETFDFQVMKQLPSHLHVTTNWSMKQQKTRH